MLLLMTGVFRERSVPASLDLKLVSVKYCSNMVFR